jgi:hypothetical protein
MKLAAFCRGGLSLNVATNLHVHNRTDGALLSRTRRRLGMSLRPSLLRRAEQALILPYEKLRVGQADQKYSAASWRLDISDLDGCRHTAICIIADTDTGAWTGIPKTFQESRTDHEE